MKFRNVVFLFLVALVLTAWLTRPGASDFEEFRQSLPGAKAMPPVIESQNGVLYSIFTITYFQAQPVAVKVADSSKAAVAVPVSKEKYLGLFGRFWKMD